jgi:hypothetical protein
MRMRRALGAVGLVALLVAAACSDPAGGQDEPDSAEESSTSATPTTAVPTPSVVADPEHSVDPPGPFEPPLTLADMLVTSDAPIRDEVVERVARLKGVKAVAAISLGQVVLESRVYDVAAVDPAAYRGFTES